MIKNLFVIGAGIPRNQPVLAGQQLGWSKVLLVSLDSIFDNLQGHRLIPKLLNYHSLVLQLLVLLEKMPQLFEKMLGQLLQFIVVVDAGVLGSYGNDLIIRIAIVHHLHDAHHLRLDQTQCLYGQGSDHEDIQGILVITIGLRDETIVHRIVKRGIDHPVQFQQTAVLIDLILRPGPLWDLDDRIDDPGCAFSWRNTMPGM